MGSRVVLPAKSVGETRRYEIDFLSRLGPEEVIESATCSVSVYCGEDATPNALLEGDPSISGRTLIRQKLTGGERGVIYMLTCTVTTDLLQVVTIKAYVAILDPDADMPSTECCTRIGNATSVNGKDFVITFPENPIAELRDGLPLYVIFDNDCTQDEPTLNPDSLGATEIVLTESIDLKAYDILTDDVLELVYDADDGTFILMNRVPWQWLAFKQSDLTASLSVAELFDNPGMPPAFIIQVVANVTTVSSSGTPTFTATVDGNALFTTDLTIDANEKSSYTATTPAVINSARRMFTSPWRLQGNCTVTGTGSAGWWLQFKVRFLS